MSKRGFAVAVTLTALTMIATPVVAAASGSYSTDRAGYDVSYPQCGQGLPQLPSSQYAIVGINGGRPFRPNACLRDQYQWAASGDRVPSLYVNLEYGSSAYGMVTCAEDDDTCHAYNYGYNSAQYAFTYAAASSDGGSFRSATTWWLDVETENAWSEDTTLNGAVVRGAIDYLQKVQGVTVGIYSTSHQWSVIAADYQPHNVPNWVAGGEDDQDVGKCRRPLWDGGQVWLFQYLVGDFDQNRAC
jgi:hypothetical protein